MSAKDVFFKNVIRNNEAQRSHEERIREDIRQFQSKTAALSQQIQHWLEGSGIEVIVWKTEFYDKSIARVLGGVTPLQRYSIDNIVLKNGTKSAKLLPRTLYGPGFKGRLALVIHNPSMAPRKYNIFLLFKPKQHKFSLYMQRGNRHTEGWILSRGKHSSVNNVVLTEDYFFQAIRALA